MLLSIIGQLWALRVIWHCGCEFEFSDVEQRRNWKVAAALQANSGKLQELSSMWNWYQLKISHDQNAWSNLGPSHGPSPWQGGCLGKLATGGRQELQLLQGEGSRGGGVQGVHEWGGQREGEVKVIQLVLWHWPVLRFLLALHFMTWQIVHIEYKGSFWNMDLLLLRTFQHVLSVTARCRLRLLRRYYLQRCAALVCRISLFSTCLLVQWLWLWANQNARFYFPTMFACSQSPTLDPSKLSFSL